jgi:hypothetical protein
MISMKRHHRHEQSTSLSTHAHRIDRKNWSLLTLPCAHVIFRAPPDKISRTNANHTHHHHDHRTEDPLRTPPLFALRGSNGPSDMYSWVRVCSTRCQYANVERATDMWTLTSHFISSDIHNRYSRANVTLVLVLP